MNENLLKFFYVLGMFVLGFGLVILHEWRNPPEKLIITGTSNERKIVNGQVCRKYYTTNGERWLICTDNLGINDTIHE